MTSLFLVVAFMATSLAFAQRTVAVDSLTHDTLFTKPLWFDHDFTDGDIKWGKALPFNVFPIQEYETEGHTVDIGQMRGYGYDTTSFNDDEIMNGGTLTVWQLDGKVYIAQYEAQCFHPENLIKRISRNYGKPQKKSAAKGVSMQKVFTEAYTWQNTHVQVTLTVLKSVWGWVGKLAVVKLPEGSRLLKYWIDAQNNTQWINQFTRHNTHDVNLNPI